MPDWLVMCVSLCCRVVEVWTQLANHTPANWRCERPGRETTPISAEAADDVTRLHLPYYSCNTPRQSSPMVYYVHWAPRGLSNIRAKYYGYIFI